MFQFDKRDEVYQDHHASVTEQEALVTAQGEAIRVLADALAEKERTNRVQVNRIVALQREVARLEQQA